MRIAQPNAMETDAATFAADGLGLGTFPRRFLLVYTVVFMLPFPLSLLSLLNYLPGFSESFLATASEWLVGVHGRLTQPIVAWMGRLFTGEEASFAFTGSGDGLASYLGVLLDVGLAAAISVLWWWWRRSRPISRRVADLCRVLLRYYLGWVMLSYGFAKVFPNQFPVMGPDRLLQPYGDSSPMGLLWTFMGAVPAYQIFAGTAEVLGGLLLLFRRTALLGALVVVAVMTNVFAMNMCFDVPVKLYSFHYLLFAVLVALPDVPRLVGLFLANVPVAPRDMRPFWYTSRWWRRMLSLAKIVLIVALVATNIQSGIERMRTYGVWAPKNDLRGLYRVEAFDISPSESEEPTADSVRWVRVGINPPGAATVQCADGTATRWRMKIDDEASTIALFDRSLLEPAPESDPLQLERLDDGRLRLTGVFEGVSIAVTLRRDERESLFKTRGFRWISEYPFNR